MQVWLNFVLVVALATMVGISVSDNQKARVDAQRQAYIENHPGLNEATGQAIAQGDLAMGMTPEQVVISWGKPNSVNVFDPQPNVEFWAYPKAMVVFDAGQVDNWVLTRSKLDNGQDLVRRYAYVLASDLPERTATLIRKGQITTGMTSEQVQASWGLPRSVLPLYDDSTGERTVWVYERGLLKRVSVTFQEDAVLSWAESPLPRPSS